MKRLVLIVPAVALLGLGSPSASAGTVYLKNGQEIEGRIIEVNDKYVVITYKNGTLEIDRKQIQAVEATEDDPVRKTAAAEPAAAAPKPGEAPGSEIQSEAERGKQNATAARADATARRERAVDEGGPKYAQHQMRRGDVFMQLGDDAVKMERYAVAAKKFEDARDSFTRAVAASLDRKRDESEKGRREDDLRKVQETRRARQDAERAAADAEKNKRALAAQREDEERRRIAAFESPASAAEKREAEAKALAAKLAEEERRRQATADEARRLAETEEKRRTAEDAEDRDRRAAEEAAARKHSEAVAAASASERAKLAEAGRAEILVFAAIADAEELKLKDAQGRLAVLKSRIKDLGDARKQIADTLEATKAEKRLTTALGVGKKNLQKSQETLAGADAEAALVDESAAKVQARLDAIAKTRAEAAALEKDESVLAGAHKAGRTSALSTEVSTAPIEVPSDSAIASLETAATQGLAASERVKAELARLADRRKGEGGGAAAVPVSVPVPAPEPIPAPAPTPTGASPEEAKAIGAARLAADKEVQRQAEADARDEAAAIEAARSMHDSGVAAAPPPAPAPAPAAPEAAPPSEAEQQAALDAARAGFEAGLVAAAPAPAPEPPSPAPAPAPEPEPVAAAPTDAEEQAALDAARKSFESEIAAAPVVPVPVPVPVAGAEKSEAERKAEEQALAEAEAKQRAALDAQAAEDAALADASKKSEADRLAREEADRKSAEDARIAEEGARVNAEADRLEREKSQRLSGAREGLTEARLKVAAAETRAQENAKKVAEIRTQLESAPQLDARLAAALEARAEVRRTSTRLNTLERQAKAVRPKLADAGKAVEALPTPSEEPAAKLAALRGRIDEALASDAKVEEAMAAGQVEALQAEATAAVGAADAALVPPPATIQPHTDAIAQGATVATQLENEVVRLGGRKPAAGATAAATPPTPAPAPAPTPETAPVPVPVPVTASAVGDDAAKKAEADRLAQEEEAKKKAEADRLAQEEEAKKKAEADRLAQEEEAKKKAEADRLVQEEEARKKAEADRLVQEEEARKKAEADRLAKEEEDRRKAARAAEARKMELAPEPVAVAGGAAIQAPRGWDKREKTEGVTSFKPPPESGVKAKVNVVVVDSEGLSPREFADAAFEDMKGIDGVTPLEVKEPSGSLAKAEIHAKRVHKGQNLIQRTGFVPKGDKIAIVTVAGAADQRAELDKLYESTLKSVK